MSLQERPVFLRMVDADYAAKEAEHLLSEILGVELLGISFDPYDSSFEIYPDSAVADITVSDEQHAAILALGCGRYWINFADGTERYCQSNRKPSASKRWDAHNTFSERKRRDEAELDRLQARVAELEVDADYYVWRLQAIIPLFEEARDALPAISLASAKLYGLDLSLGDRMDRAGTATREDFDTARKAKP